MSPSIYGKRKPYSSAQAASVLTQPKATRKAALKAKALQEIKEHLNPPIDYSASFAEGRVSYEKPTGPKELWNGDLVGRSYIGDA